MNRRSLLGFIILNVIVTFITVFGVFSLLQRITPQATAPVSQPLFVVVTATQDPKGTQVSYVIITATPGPGVTPADTGATPIPPQNPTQDTGVQPNPPTVSSGPTNGGTVPTAASGGVDSGAPTLPPNIPTLDPSLLPPDLGTPEAIGAPLSTARSGTASANSASNGASSNCQTYALKQGDTAGNIATTFGISLDDLMHANKLKETDLTRLQIGQILIIPLNGCGLATQAATTTNTPTKFVVPTTPPTATIAPTADKAQIEITQVLAAGDINSEGIEIHNISGGVIHMQGWTVTDATGLKYTFPDYQMFPKGRVTLYTKKGVNTPVVLYWGQSKAVWGDPSEQITIFDAQGIVQATRPATASAPASSIQNDNGTVPTPTAGG